MRVVTIPKIWEIRTEQDIITIHKKGLLLHCELCGKDIAKDDRFKTIVEHNDGGISDQESQPVCCWCFDKLRIGFSRVSKELRRNNDLQQSTGEMTVENKTTRR